MLGPFEISGVIPVMKDYLNIIQVYFFTVTYSLNLEKNLSIILNPEWNNKDPHNSTFSSQTVA